jgi:hypothetical protein
MIRKHVYGSLSEMVTAADRAFQDGRCSPSVTKLDSRFLGRHFDSWADVVNKVTDYWPEGLDTVQEMLYELRESACQARPRSRVRRAHWSADDGDEIDTDRLRSGQDAWRRTFREEHDAPQHVVLVFSISTSCARDSASILWRGAVGIILADLLEEAGYRVELWGVDKGNRAYRDNSDSFQAVRFKASETPVDISNLTNGVSCWFYRSVFFQDLSVETDVLVEPSLGSPTTIDDATPEVQEIAGNATTLVIDGLWDRHAAAAKVKQVMNGLAQ